VSDEHGLVGLDDDDAFFALLKIKSRPLAN
jgi:hypothetical protein